MFKILNSFFILSALLLFGSYIKAETVYSDKWSVNNEYPFHYTSSITTGEHGLIIEGKQSGVAKGRPVNYALVTKGLLTDRLISFEKVYGNTNFNIKLKAPKGSSCKIRIFVYGGIEFPKGTIKVSRY